MIEFHDTLCCVRSNDDYFEALAMMRARGSTRLDFNCNGFPIDLSALRGADWLTSVRIESARIADISPLYDCINLDSLQLMDCKIAGGVDLRSCGQVLRSLYLRPVNQVRGISHCRKVESLYFGTYNTGENLKDTGLVQELTELKNLSLFSSKFEDFSNIACPNIRSIDLYRCGDVSSLAGLDNFESLEVLELKTKVSVADFSMLARCQELKRIVIAGKTQVEDLEFLRGLPNLRSLLIETKVLSGDLTPILQCKALESLYVKGGRGASHTLADLKHELGVVN